MHPAAWVVAAALHLGVLALSLRPDAPPLPLRPALSVGIAGLAAAPEAGAGPADPPAMPLAELPAATQPEALAAPDPAPEPLGAQNAAPPIPLDMPEPLPLAPATPLPPALREPAPVVRALPRPAPRAPAGPPRSGASAVPATPGTAEAEAPSAMGAASPGPDRPAPRGQPTSMPPAYAQAIAAILRRNLRYPPAARAMGVEGEALVRFSIARDGTIAAAELLRGAGFALLDHEAMALLRRVSPLPHLPAEVVGETALVQVPIRFTLR